MSPRLAFALEAAFVAGRSTLAHFRTGVDVEKKSDSTPVTVADREAETLIRRLIAKQYPADAILGEEHGGDLKGLDRWVIDPIDGTKSFVCGVPLYATLISYEQNGEAILGACYFPALDEMVYAEKGGGAFWNGRPCRVSTNSNLSNSYISSGSPGSMIDNGRWDGFRRLIKSTVGTRTWSDAYGHALVATGRVDAMIDPIVNPWDISSMAIIVREAGGRFTDFSGSERLSNEAISSNGLLHDEILRAFL
jgi:histidinol phosphatase-like enzyme (inositol monophosphatase family)